MTFNISSDVKWIERGDASVGVVIEWNICVALFVIQNLQRWMCTRCARYKYRQMHRKIMYKIANDHKRASVAKYEYNFIPFIWLWIVDIEVLWFMRLCVSPVRFMLLHFDVYFSIFSNRIYERFNGNSSNIAFITRNHFDCVLRVDWMCHSNHSA